MRTRFFQLPGVSFVAIGLQTAQSRGIEIDNSSGSWLYIPSLETFVPPFTIGWSYDFPYAVSSVDIHAGIESPAGQVSTTAGDGVTVYLSDNGVGASQGDIDTVGLAKAGIGSAGSPAGGAAFIAGFTPILAAADLDRIVPATTGTGTVTLIPAVAGKRIRLRTLDITTQFGTITTQSASNIYWRGSTTSGRPPLRYLLSPHAQPTVFREWPSGLDFPVGVSLDFSAITNYADQRFSSVASYELI